MSFRIAQLYFIFGPTVTSEDELVGPLVFYPVVFKELDASSSHVAGIFINGAEVPKTDYTVHFGKQTEADSMLLKYLPGWTDQYVLQGIPYIALKTKYRGEYAADDGRLNIMAELVINDEEN